MAEAGPAPSAVAEAVRSVRWAAGGSRGVAVGCERWAAFDAASLGPADARVVRCILDIPPLV
ncbi:hypothetical protein GCM10022230_08020 [Pseudoclavibacter caeni]